MYINILDLFSIYFEPDKGLISSFLLEEYKNELNKKQRNKLLINLVFRNESRKESEYVVRDPVSYDDMGAFIFDKENKKLRIDFLTLGKEKSELVCDPNFHAPFFAIFIDYLVYVYALKQDKILVHSSCFIYKGVKILCPAWRNVGKTNLLLSFMLDDALYLSDDWCLVNKEGYAEKIPKSVCLFEYNLSAFPQIASKIDPSLLPLIEFIGLTESGKIKASEFVKKDIRKNLIKRVGPTDLFPNKVINSPEKIDFIFNLVKNSINPVEEVSSSILELETLVRRLYEILRLEQSPFRLAYSVFKARTGKENNYLKSEREVFLSVAMSAFKDSDIFELLVPNQQVSESVKNEISIRLRIP